MIINILFSLARSFGTMPLSGYSSNFRHEFDHVLMILASINDYNNGCKTVVFQGPSWSLLMLPGILLQG